MSSPPNIIVFQADQLTALALQLYGGFCETPFLNSLAEKSTLFENAYCNYPLCAPSRLSMMTGRLSSDIGAYDNAAELPSAIPTFAHYLRNQGYHTCLSGKMHFIGADQFHGFEERLTTEIYPADFAWLPDWANQQQSFAPIRNTIERAGVSAWNMQLAYDEDVAFQAVRKIYEYARHPQNPFCMVVSFTHPHPPFLATPEYWERYEDSDIPSPNIGRLPDSILDPHSQRCRRVIGVDQSDVDKSQTQAARHAYYSMIHYFDDKLKQVNDALELAELADNTAIFVVSDHGEMLGERGLWTKDCFFEGAMRIPFIAKLPGVQGGRRINSNVSLLDLAPTLLELAGVKNEAIVSPLYGNSLIDAINGDTSNWPDRVLAEYSAEAAQAPMVLIRQGRYKYIQAAGDPPQLFDLSNDHDELINLATEAQHQNLLNEFSKAVEQHWNLETLDEEIRQSQIQRKLIGESLAKGHYQSWDYQPKVDYSKIYVRDPEGAELTDRKVRVAAKGYKLPGT
ncbi:MAG: choline-sulfatase [Gammaproteobacteria bacterium]|jgi:choline-sulfatase